jgi:DNA-binding transcriptional LysR family regulator
MLFRLGRGVRLTPAGETLVGPARQALRDIETARSGVASVAGLDKGCGCPRVVVVFERDGQVAAALVARGATRRRGAPPSLRPLAAHRAPDCSANRAGLRVRGPGTGAGIAVTE